MEQQKVSKDSYTKLKTLGRGAFGDVSLVENKLTKDKFAMKIIEKKLLAKEQKQHQAYIEKTVLQKIKHPNMIQIINSFQDNHQLYFILEYCSGGSFSEFLHQIPGPLSISTIQFYSGEILNIIEHLHNQGIVHRDLKPENIMLTNTRHLKLIDFGTALITNFSIFDPQTKLYIDEIKKKRSNEDADYQSHSRNKGTFVGTCEYVSPELLKDDQCHFPSDIWAFGCILYKMFTQMTPFNDQTEYLIFQRIQNLEYEMNDKINLLAQDLIKKIFVCSPVDRISIQEIKQHEFYKVNQQTKILQDRQSFKVQSKNKFIKFIQAGWFLFKQRKLILYNNYQLEYFDPQKNQLKGQIQLTLDLVVEQKNATRWQIQIPSRNYYFKSSESETLQWINNIKIQLKKINS